MVIVYNFSFLMSLSNQHLNAEIRGIPTTQLGLCIKRYKIAMYSVRSATIKYWLSYQTLYDLENFPGLTPLDAFTETTLHK
jgi:hypothetical protein